MTRLLLTNDDGIEAPGLQALYESVQFAGAHAGREVDIIVVAPDRGRSECSHSVETRETLQLTAVRPGWTSLNGTPVDCVRAGVIAMGFEADIVLSGVNSGANLGVNLMVSGTFAAAREASLLGIPAMAISQYRRPPMPRSWDHVPHWLAETINDFWLTAEAPMAPLQALLWNVNLPAVHDDPHRIPERVECEVDRFPLERIPEQRDDGIVIYQCDYHGRPKEPSRDVAECFDGKITISELTPFLEGA